MIVYATANLAVAVLSTTFAMFAVLWVLNVKYMAYFLLITLYSGFGFYTMWF